jgi:hypothetical protein
VVSPLDAFEAGILLLILPVDNLLLTVAVVGRFNPLAVPIADLVMVLLGVVRFASSFFAAALTYIGVVVAPRLGVSLAAPTNYLAVYGLAIPNTFFGAGVFGADA